MLIIAHRGASGTYEENSREAFQAALEMDADAVETDVRRCVCHGILKLSHDPIQEKQNCEKLLSFKDFLQIKARGRYLPLSDLETDIGEEFALHIEIKDKGLLHDILNITQDLRYRKDFIFSSFLWLELLKMRWLNHGARIGLLWNPKEIALPCWLVALAGKILSAESIHIELDTLTQAMVHYFRRKRFAVYAYSAEPISPRDQIAKAAFLDVDGIFTDYPAYSRDYLSKTTFQ